MTTQEDQANPVSMMPDYGLLFYLSADFEENDVSKIQGVVNSLERRRNWTISPPEFVDEWEEPNSGNPVDQTIRTVGGFLCLHPPSMDPKDRASEKSQYQDVECVINELIEFSKHTGQEISVELGGTASGHIANGEPNDLIKNGLLGEWRRVLGLE